MLKLTPFRIVALYVVLSILWITSSDVLIAFIARDSRLYAVLSIIQGWLFIVVTATLLYGLIRQYALSRNRAEETLWESEERFKELADSLPQTVFEADLSGNIRYANRAGLAAFGYTDADLEAGVNIMQLLAAEDRQRAGENIGKRLRGEGQGNMQYTALRKEGARFPAAVHSVPIMRKGTPVGLRGILVDVTDRMLSEKAIRESEEKYRFVVEQARDGVIIAQDGMLRYANPAMAAITGYSVEVLTSRPFIDFLHPQDRTMVLDRHIQRMHGTMAPLFSYKFRILTRDGRTVWTETRGANQHLERKTCDHQFSVGHNRPHTNRGGAAPGGKTQVHRHPGRRDRARLQQPPDRHPRKHIDRPAPGDRRAAGGTAVRGGDRIAPGAQTYPAASHVFPGRLPGQEARGSGSAHSRKRRVCPSRQ